MTATKRDRLAEARPVRHALSRYIDALTPHIEQYLADAGADAHRVRMTHLLNARQHLEALIALEQTHRQT